MILFMLADKIYGYLKIICPLLVIALFIFLQFVRYTDTVSHHILLQNDYSWQAHWDFFVNWDNFYVLLACIVIGYLPLLLLGLGGWLYRLVCSNRSLD
ncbi:hypothetical protein LNQ82_04890 [Conchiformibius steedae DSM 2580]|uniref:Uncharacterized protein n=1 Tax=Conchiformibius steedae DSM 2580 TaxID=1121352 RepID=A0AAE9HUR0_9NEIS|nr:hypothetical protein [Conchiformibius steedae]QMT33826.1 hypothetical protein H3L98_01965 [Conchiformibius steedae]URD68487.1 hypothetical protein LNQ82_04890 [Conchiformibius steedae DSM 2580]